MLLSIPKVKFDPPIRINLGEGVLSTRRSLSSLEKSRDVLALGVAGNAKIITAKITVGIAKNFINLDINLLMFNL
jgi:hypothetical protein